MLNFISKYWPMLVMVFTAIGGLSTVVVVIRALFPNWYKDKVSPWLKLMIPHLKSLDDMIEAILKTAPNNAVFKSLDAVVDYLIKELREAGYDVTEQDVLQRLNDGRDGVKVVKSEDGWQINYNKSF